MKCCSGQAKNQNILKNTEDNNMANIPQINASEIAEWEAKFREEVSPSVQFAVGNNAGKSMRFYNGTTGTDAQWSGTITFQNDSWIKWNFKARDVPFIEVKAELTEECSKMLTNLFTFYNSWKDEWIKKLTIPDNVRKDVDANTGGAQQNVPPPAPAQAAGNTPPPPPPAGGAVNEQFRTKESIIDLNRERMMRLAKLWK